MVWAIVFLTIYAVLITIYLIGASCENAQLQNRLRKHRACSDKEEVDRAYDEGMQEGVRKAVSLVITEFGLSPLNLFNYEELEEELEEDHEPKDAVESSEITTKIGD